MLIWQRTRRYVNASFLTRTNSHEKAPLTNCFKVPLIDVGECDRMAGLRKEPTEH
jgi:hypothetical protein